MFGVRQSKSEDLPRCICGLLSRDRAKHIDMRIIVDFSIWWFLKTIISLAKWYLLFVRQARFLQKAIFVFIQRLMATRSFYKILFVLFLVGGCTSSYSQNKLDSLQYLDDVVVLAKPFQEVIPSQKMNAQQIGRLNSHSVADALRYFAGVQIKDYGGMGGMKTVNVRNMGSQHVGVFYDGIQLGNAQNGTVDLGKFSLDDMEEISLYNGQRSEIFQSAKDFSSAASIYMKAKKPRFKIDEKTHLLVRYKAGSINLYNPSVRWEQKLSNTVNMSLSSEYVKSDGEYKFRYKRVNSDGRLAYDTTATRQNSDIEALRLEGGLYGTITDGYWDAKLYYYGSKRGLPGAIVKQGEGLDWKNGERQKDKSFFAQTNFYKSFSDQYQLQLKGKFAYDYTHYMALDSMVFMEEGRLTKELSYNYYYQQEYYLSAVNLYQISKIWSVSLSADFQYNRLNSTSNIKTQFSYPKRYTTLGSLATAIDLGKFKAQASIVGTYVHESVKYNTKAPDKRELTPAVFVGYKPFDDKDLNFRAFYKRIFRMPTFNELYYTQIGYSLLRPEYTDQYDVGFTYAKSFKKSSFIDGFSFQADAYYMDVTDKIVAAPTGSFFRWMMTNMGKVEGKGVDLIAAVNAHVGDVNMNINLTYGYSDVHDKGSGFSADGDQIPYTPWHSGSAIAGLQYKGWGLNYSFIYVGERYDGNVNNIAYNYVEPWYTHDISLQKEFMVKQYKIKGSIEMNNALNQYYDVVLNYPMPGRNFRFIVSVEI